MSTIAVIKAGLFGIIVLALMVGSANAQDSIRLVGRGAPTVEQITSELRCETTQYRLSWTNHAISTSGGFSLLIEGRPVRNAGTDRVEEFLRLSRNVRLASVTCGQGQDSIEIALSGLLFQPPSGAASDEVIRFFRLGRADRPN